MDLSLDMVVVEMENFTGSFQPAVCVQLLKQWVCSPTYVSHVVADIIVVAMVLVAVAVAAVVVVLLVWWRFINVAQCVIHI